MATTLEVRDVASGQILDRATLDGESLTYETGVAKPLFVSMIKQGMTSQEAYDLRNGWSNGYVVVTQAGR